MRSASLPSFIVALVALSGCATPPRPPIALSASVIADASHRIAIVGTKLPKPDTYFPGASCLLCMAAASMSNSSLTSYTQSLTTTDLESLKQEIADLIVQHGGVPVVVDEPIVVDKLGAYKSTGPDVATKDFTALKSKYAADRLVVLDLASVGVQRTYSAYIATSDAKGMLRGTAYMIDLTTNHYDWYLPIDVLRSAEGPWDEPPKFPGLTNAYYQAIETAKDDVLRPFRK